MTPTVSVVTATYNWSSVLRFSISSVLWQTFQDFEMLVVGDGCTDDSAEVVASFNDPRLIWHNLPENTGSQPMPNNTGISMARGCYIAYLGHDDVWHPKHLENLVAAMDAGAELAHSLLVSYAAPGTGTLSVAGVYTKERKATRKLPLVPSCIMHRRDLVEQVGWWKDYRTITQAPDSEFIGRWLDHHVIAVPHLTAFKFPASKRKNAYIEKASFEQSEMIRRIREEPDFMERELTTIIRAYVLGKQNITLLPPNPKIAQRGWHIEQSRRLRGLDPRPIPPPTRQAYINYALKTIRSVVPLPLRRLWRRVRG